MKRLGKIVPFLCACLVLVATACVLASGQVPGADVSGDFAAANTLYREGKFADAAQAYAKILGRGVASGALYYNLGNAYVKTGEIGKAVLVYTRALRENPRDPEAKANLEFTKGLLADRTEDRGILALLENFSPAQWLSRRENVWAFLILYWIGVLAGIVAIVWPGRKKPLAIVAAVLLSAALVFGASVFFRSSLWARPQAIVLAREVDVRYGPVLAESTAFTLHEGSKVKILRSAEDWSQIYFAKGKIGWVPTETLEKV